MSMARDLIAGQSPPAIDSDNRLTTWYAQGHSDGLGDRLLMFDNTSGPPWEILRFTPTLARDSRFEAALHERVKHLSSFRHPAFPRVRPITELGQEDGLAVVSTYVSGVSLSQALTKPRSAAFAAVLIRHLAPALTALQQHGPGIAHGALNADRIILTAEGQPMIREHMVGSALASLELPVGRLWADFGILASLDPETKPTLDCRSDVIQLALVGLSLMTGRRIGPDEYPDKVPQLLDQIAQRASRNPPEFFQSLRHWLERALQLADDPFHSAREANDALDELWEEPAHGDEPPDAPLRGMPEAHRDPLPPALPVSTDPHAADPVEVESSNHQVPRVRPRVARAMRWAAVAAGVLAVGEAVLIGRLLYQRRVTVPSVNAKGAIESPPLVNAGPGTQPNRVLPSPVVPTTAPVTATPTELKEITAASQRRGGFRLSSSVEVHVLDGERLLGSSHDGPIVVAPGRRELEFVNSAIGYRMRRVIDVKPGQISPLTITVPNGIVNINAMPWAEVWIDGKPFGETPLGNLSIAPGEHEIVFRHPELGERRQKAFVRTDVPTRVSTNLQQPQ
ncbi:MAG TPA: hypothetical protein VI485_16340 [Vicinamibacterales bacterium]|nr:hypothetical protein [Vicinamibacterales bacterium]